MKQHRTKSNPLFDDDSIGYAALTSPCEEIKTLITTLTGGPEDESKLSAIFGLLLLLSHNELQELSDWMKHPPYTNGRKEISPNLIKTIKDIQSEIDTLLDENVPQPEGYEFISMYI